MQVKSHETAPMNWAVGMTTAPRMNSTLSQSINNLKVAGWAQMRIFAEPGSSIPANILGETSVSLRDQTLGAFPNWYLGLTELYLDNPHADAYLICQDDIVMIRDTRQYLEECLWPATEIGVVSLYCPSHDHRDDASGFLKVKSGWNTWGALAYIFSNPGVREFLSDLIVLNHRHHGPHQGLRNIDSIVGSWCERRQLPYFVHVPTLTQHIGRSSTIWKNNTNEGRRKAIKYDPRLLLTEPESQNDSISE